MQKLDRLCFTFALIAMVLLTLGTVSISSAANQTASLPSRTLGDKWTYSVNYDQPSGCSFPSTLVIIAVVAGFVLAGFAVGIMFFVRKQRTNRTIVPQTKSQFQTEFKTC